MTRRRTIGGLAAALGAAPASAADAARLEIIEAPSNLGLRPPRAGHEPGVWRAPEAFRRGGLHDLLGSPPTVALPRPSYSFEPVPGTNIRNGTAIRDFSLQVAAAVRRARVRGAFPLVLGGDCSILLGCLLAARDEGRCGLVHVDGHSDFFNPDPRTRPPPYSAAGMDLALATGRGEPLLARWQVPGGALVADADVMQIGEREELDPDYAYPEINATVIQRVPVRRVLEGGIDALLRDTARWVAARGLRRVWLHVDVDVLDSKVMPAVDSPGSPGLDYDQLAALMDGLSQQAPLIGTDVTVFDPELDETGEMGRRLSAALAKGLGRWTARPRRS